MQKQRNEAALLERLDALIQQQERSNILLSKILQPVEVGCWLW